MAPDHNSFKGYRSLINLAWGVEQVLCFKRTGNAEHGGFIFKK